MAAANGGTSTPASGRHRAPRRHLVAALLVGLLLATLSPGSGGPGRSALAQTPGGDRASNAEPLRLIVARFTGVVGPGSVPSGASAPQDVFLRLLVEHAGDDTVEDVEVVVETFGRATSRGSLQLALDDGVVTGPRTVESHPVRDGSVEPGDVAAVDVFLPVSQVVQGARSGVYPIQVTLTRGTTVLDRFVTAVVHLEEPALNPLDAVVVWPIDAAPWTTPDADRTTFDSELAPGGRIDDLVRGLEAAPSSGVVAAVTPHLLDALVRRADGLPEVDGGAATASDDAETTDRAAVQAADLLARIRSVLADLPNAPVAGPYASADLDALVDAGPQMIGIAGELASDGPRRVTGLTGRATQPGTVLPRVALSPRSLDVLAGEHLLLSYEDVAGPDLELGTDLPYPVQRLRAPSGRILTASIADPHVSGQVAQPRLDHGTPLAVQRVLAETALIHFEAPGVADRPLLVLPPPDWDPGARFARDLAQALSRSPWLRLSPGDSHARTVVGDLREAVLPEQAPHLPTDLVREVGTTLTAVAAIAASRPEGAATIDGRSVADLDDQLRRSTSSWFIARPDIPRQMIDDVAATVERSYGTIQVPTGDSVTLLSEQGKIPVTLRRESGDAIDVEVEVRSRGALTWPQGPVQQRRLVPGATQTLSFDVIARSRGDIPVEVIVRDVAGARILADATIRVRSTFVSRPALIATATVVVLLLLLGRWRRRPSRRPPDDDPAATPAADLSVLPGGGDPPGRA